MGQSGGGPLSMTGSGGSSQSMSSSSGATEIPFHQSLHPLGFLNDKPSEGALDPMHFPKPFDGIDHRANLTEPQEHS
jgi:hypothetical protein